MSKKAERRKGKRERGKKEGKGREGGREGRREGEKKTKKGQSRRAALLVSGLSSPGACFAYELLPEARSTLQGSA